MSEHQNPVPMNDRDINLILGAFTADYICVSKQDNPDRFKSENGTPLYPPYEQTLAWHTAYCRLPRNKHNMIEPFRNDDTLSATLGYFNYRIAGFLDKGEALRQLGQALPENNELSIGDLLGNIAQHGVIRDNKTEPLFGDKTINADFIHNMNDIAKDQVARTVSVAFRHNRAQDDFAQNMITPDAMEAAAFDSFPADNPVAETAPKQRNFLQRFFR